MAEKIENNSREIELRNAITLQDPTSLTVALMRREIESIEKFFTVRLDSMDKAQTLFEMNLTRVPTDVDKQITHLQQLVVEKFNSQDEKFHSIQVQFTERDTRTEQTSKDSKVAVDAALQAAKEAVEKQNTASALAIAKAETGTAKQIDQLTELFQTAIGAMDAKFNDLKERLLLIEGRTVGLGVAQITQQASHASQQSSTGNIVAMVGIGVALFVSVTGLIVTFIKSY